MERAGELQGKGGVKAGLPYNTADFKHGIKL
jgi:hypothetical protein